MKPRRILSILHRAPYAALGLIAAIGLSSCAPAIINSPAAPIASPMVTDTLITATFTAADTSVPDVTASTPTQTVEVQAIATSRGPNLEATDPATVNLASGQLQLIEFFRFT